MSPTSAPLAAPLPTAAWWREKEVLFLLLIVFGGYFYRASDMNLRGEEPRRAQVAAEMIQRGDWVVPREQGDPFLSRPPMQNWLIALSFVGLGERDTLTARLPSMLATLFIVLILYGYSRTYLSRTGALAAAAAYATFGEIFQTGRMAETESVFILFVGGALILWHWGMVRQWPAVTTWCITYGLMACGALTKGPQAPCYVLGSIGLYCLVARQWRHLFSLGHVSGIVFAAGILAAWHIPYYERLGMKGIYGVWMNDTAPRLLVWQGLLVHFFEFPLEVFGCLMPWSPLLLLFCRRELRASVGAAKPQVLFLAVSLGLCFPTCWLPPDGQTRYAAPLYPLFAALIGFVVQRCSEAEPGSTLANDWRRYLGVVFLMMVVTGVGLAAAPFVRSHPKLGSFAEPPFSAVVFAGVMFGLAWLIYRASNSGNRLWRTGWAVAVVAAFMVVLFNGPVLNARVRRSEDAPGAIARLKQQLPPDVAMVSIGHIDANFAFEWGPLIECLPSADPIPEGGYFCYQANGGPLPVVPFAWDQLAAISMDRNRLERPLNVLVVGRRQPGTGGGQIAVTARGSRVGP